MNRACYLISSMAHFFYKLISGINSKSQVLPQYTRNRKTQHLHVYHKLRCQYHLTCISQQGNLSDMAWWKHNNTMLLITLHSEVRALFSSWQYTLKHPVFSNTKNIFNSHAQCHIGWLFFRSTDIFPPWQFPSMDIFPHGHFPPFIYNIRIEVI